jgi:hypothetical protein
MLVPSRHLQEISLESNAEYNVLANSSSFQRLTHEYIVFYSYFF